MYQTKNRVGRSYNLDESNGNWKGGRRINTFGYVLVRKKNHPFCYSDGYIPEHRLIMEQHLGRYLKSGEVIHHINGIKTDNRIENLEITTQQEHGKLHSPFLDKSDRTCFTCGANKTYLREGKYEQWCPHPITRRRWICRICYEKIKKRIKKYHALGECRFKLSAKGIEDVED